MDFGRGGLIYQHANQGPKLKNQTFIKGPAMPHRGRAIPPGMSKAPVPTPRQEKKSIERQFIIVKIGAGWHSQPRS